MGELIATFPHRAGLARIVARVEPVVVTSSTRRISFFPTAKGSSPVSRDALARGAGTSSR